MKRVLFVVNVDWFFESHRLAIAKKAIQSGYEVHIGCKNTGRFAFFESLGIKTHSIDFSRSDTNLKKNIKTLYELHRIILYVNADICHFITIKPVLFGGFLSVLKHKHKSVFSVTGLGSSFLEHGTIAKVRSYIFLKIYSYFFSKKTSFVIFQNTTDLHEIFPGDHSIASNLRIISGSGVDLDVFKPSKKNFDNPLMVVMAARALKDKGVREYFKAANEIKARFCEEVNFYFYGDCDPENPTSLTEDELIDLNSNSSVEICGFTNKCIVCWLKLIYLCCSYREGFPKVVMEASASGCVSLVSDVPGCRDAVVSGKTGFLFKKKSPKSIVDVLEHCIKNRTILSDISKLSRIHAEQHFSIHKIVNEHMQLYEEAMQ